MLAQKKKNSANSLALFWMQHISSLLVHFIVKDQYVSLEK